MGGRLKRLAPRLVGKPVGRIEVKPSVKTSDNRMRGRAWMRRRDDVFARDGYICRSCGCIVAPHQAECDHIVPLASGGTDDLANLQTLCKICHGKKSAEENRSR